MAIGNNLSLVSPSSVTTRLATQIQNETRPSNITSAAIGDIGQGVAYYTGTLTSNSTLTLPIKVDNLSDLRIDIDSLYGVVQARLENATGTVLIPNQATPIRFSFPSTSLAVGSYRLVLTTGVLTTPIQYFVKAEANTNLILQPTITPPTAGSPILGNIKANMFISGTTNITPITGAIVTTTMTTFASNGMSTTTNLTLLDNGTNGDTLANDGIYTSQLPAGLTSQTILAEVRASGTNDLGLPFTRYETAVSQARSGEITFNGNYNRQTYSNLLPATSDIDTIYFEAGVTTQQVGAYRIEATLSAANGTVVAISSNTVILTSNGTLRVKFEGLPIQQQAIEGPYRLTALKAYYINPDSTSREANAIDNPSVLPALNITLNQLKRPAFEANNVITDSGLNLDPSGRFQALQVTFTLAIANAGVYSYSTILRTPSGALIDAAQGVANLPAGLNVPLVLTFNATNIYAMGENGPYLLQDLLIQEPSSSRVSLYKRSAGQTRYFLYSEFIRPVNCATPLVVTNNTDDGRGLTCGSLSLAINEAVTLNQNVNINLAGKYITITGSMPVISNTRGFNVSLDGGCNVQDGRGVPNGHLTTTNGFSVATPLKLTKGVTINGLSITGFGGAGISVQGDNNQIICNWIGTNDGINATGNSYGVEFGRLSSRSANNNKLGLAGLPQSGNLISGNRQVGVLVLNGLGNQAYYNWIGLQKDGVSPLRNSVYVAKGSQLKFGFGNRIQR